MSPDPKQQEHDEKRLQLSHDDGHAPTDGYEPVPLWLVTIFGAFLAWGGWYIGAFNAGWHTHELDELAGNGPAVSASQPAEDPITLGKRIFMGNCVSCHQADGKGLPGQYPTLNGSEWVNGNPAWMKRIVLHGLEGQITVKGASYNNVMPPFGGKFTDKQIAAVISFVRTNADWGNKAAAVTPEQVAATRAATKDRTAAWSPSELQAIKSDEAPATQSTATATTTQPTTTQQ